MNPSLKIYEPVARAIGELFGESCEVVIHDLSQPEESVVFVVNGDVTGRKRGQSFDHLVRQVLLNKNLQDDCSPNYYFETEQGKKIKSVSSLLRDEKGQVIGVLCINYDVTALQHVESFLEIFLDKKPAVMSTEPEQDIMSVIDQLIANIIGKQDIKNLSRKKCVEIVKFMDEKGIFLVKGSIDKVAEMMGVSRVTIYSYLDEAKGKR